MLKSIPEISRDDLNISEMFLGYILATLLYYIESTKSIKHNKIRKNKDFW